MSASFRPWYFSRTPDKGWIKLSPRHSSGTGSWMSVVGEPGSEVVENLHLACRGLAEATERVNSTKCPVPTSRRAHSIWNIWTLPRVQETGRGTVLDLPNSHFRRGVQLGQWSWLVLIFFGGRIFLPTSLLPFRFKEGGDTKAESSFDSLYPIKSYTSGSETISQVTPHTGFTRQTQSPGTISSVECVCYKWVP